MFEQKIKETTVDIIIARWSRAENNNHDIIIV